MDIVEHCHLEFIDGIRPKQISVPYQTCFDKTKERAIDIEIENLKKLGVINDVDYDHEQYISTIFSVPKKNTDEHRMILNLKEVNKYVVSHHFKMDTFEKALKLVTPGTFFSSIDLRHAYYSVSIAKEDRKFLRFKWKNKIYQYTCLPNGLLSAPRLFTKLMKPVFSTLRQYGHKNVGYIDDSLLVGESEEECSRNVQDTYLLMEWLGFVVHEKKSVFKPTKQIVFLGNNIDSDRMIVTLPKDKVNKIVEECYSLMNKTKASIRLISRIIGLLVSTFSAVDFGRLHYRNLERKKIQELKNSFGNFDVDIFVSSEMKSELLWWVEHLEEQKRVIDREDPDITITTDASRLGYGAVCKNEKMQGRWNLDEKEMHINSLELLAIFNALKAFCKTLSNVHVKVFSDNSSAIAYVNNMGGIKSQEMNELALKLWFWCIDRNIWVSLDHVPGKYNIADVESRKFDDHTEWMLDKEVFSKLVEIWGSPDHDLFATNLNKQLISFSSWKPDPEAQFVNAFSVVWSKDIFYYLFPPFSLISRCLQKIRKDQTEALMIVPLWSTQLWYPMILDMLIDIPRLIPQRKRLLTIPGTEKIHPLYNQIRLLACRLSGKIWKIREFQKRLPESYWHLGEILLKNNMLHMSSDGLVSVVRNRLIQFYRL